MIRLFIPLCIIALLPTTHCLSQDANLDSVYRHQSTDSDSEAWAQDSELMDIPAYRELTEQLKEAQAELFALRSLYEEQNGQDNANIFHNASFSGSFYQPDAGGSPGGGGGGGGDVATQSQNPVGGLWMMWLQNDMKLLEGPGDGKRVFNTTVFQPVMPIQLTETWKVINRPVFMFNSFEVPGMFNFRPGGSQDPVAVPTDPFSTVAGLGDIALIQWLSNSPADSRFVTGYGWNWMFPAGSANALGTGRTSLGPSFVAMYLGDTIITGAIMQQYWSIDKSPRTRVSLMDLQYVFRYRLNPMFSVGFAPNIQWDQVTDKVTVPVGIGFDTMTMTKGGLPIRWGAELQYFASHESPTRRFDPEWNFRLYLSPIIRAPAWATNGLFGGKCCN
jgi:hypothetical protein